MRATYPFLVRACVRVCVDVFQIMSEIWKTMSADEREAYRSKARDDQKRYKAEQADKVTIWQTPPLVSCAVFGVSYLRVARASFFFFFFYISCVILTGGKQSSKKYIPGIALYGAIELEL